MNTTKAKPVQTDGPELADGKNQALDTQMQLNATARTFLQIAATKLG